MMATFMSISTCRRSLFLAAPAHHPTASPSGYMGPQLWQGQDFHDRLPATLLAVHNRRTMPGACCVLPVQADRPLHMPCPPPQRQSMRLMWAWNMPCCSDW